MRAQTRTQTKLRPNSPFLYIPIQTQRANLTHFSSAPVYTEAAVASKKINPARNFHSAQEHVPSHVYIHKCRKTRATLLYTDEKRRRAGSRKSNFPVADARAC